LLCLATVWLAACSGGESASNKTLAIATVLPTTGVDAPLGLAMQNAVDLAVQQHATLGKGFTLAVVHVDAASSNPASAATTLASDPHILGIVGPADSQTALGMLPIISQNGLTTLSPGATLPGLTQATAAAAEKLSFAQLHPQGTPVAFFRLPRTDDALGKAAAHIAGHAVFIVDDGTTSGRGLASAFSLELKATHGSVVGQKSLAVDVPDSAQSVVSAIFIADPDTVFFAGGTAAGAALRGTLTLSGAPQLPLLTAGQIANHPGWAATVGVAAAAGNTTALLPAQELATLPKAKAFVAAYQAAFPGQAVLPQGALAYDAAQDEIAAIQSLVGAGKVATRAAVRAAVAAARYVGVTGALAFDKSGDDTTSLPFSLYACDTKGAWHYQKTLTG
jgi:branched-chain amino acid transport system substrate-binding protein